MTSWEYLQVIFVNYYGDKEIQGVGAAWRPRYENGVEFANWKNGPSE